MNMLLAVAVTAVGYGLLLSVCTVYTGNSDCAEAKYRRLAGNGSWQTWTVRLLRSVHQA